MPSHVLLDGRFVAVVLAARHPLPRLDGIRSWRSRTVGTVGLVQQVGLFQFSIISNILEINKFSLDAFLIKRSG